MISRSRNPNDQFCNRKLFFVIFDCRFRFMIDRIFQLTKDEKNHFRNIFQNYYQPLYHLSLSYLEDEDEAKGVVQDAFVKLWEIRNELRAGSNLRNFLFTLVKNNCLNILKRRQILLKHHETIRLMELHYQYESLDRMSDNYLELKELQEKITVAVQNLPEHCRIVFEMSRFDELKNREIAEKLGISQKTVEAHLTKALKILRNELRDYLPVIVALYKILN